MKQGEVLKLLRRHSHHDIFKELEDAAKIFKGTDDLKVSTLGTDMSWRSAGIVCTLGPGSQNIDMMQKLIEAGMDVARFNFSHGSHDYHRKLMNNVREAATKSGRMIAIALDTKGPEIRTGTFINEEEELKAGSKLTITTDDAFQDKGTAKKIWVTYKDIAKSLKPGMTVYIDDGLLSLTVESISQNNDINCVVTNGGTISNRKGVNLPGAKITLPALSEKDKADIAFGVKEKVDIIFASFIRKKEDVLSIKKLIPKEIIVVSKIENQEGCDNFEEILEVSDGIMVARGDLGIEIDATKVFVQQKRMIRLCRAAGKPVIVATQMLQSMVQNPRPTRAEVSDVANAILDGADCVMLSGETAKGKYPVEAVLQMDKTCQVAEHNLKLPQLPHDLHTGAREAVVFSACNLAKLKGAAAIICITNTGTTARLISRARPKCPILAVIGSSSSHVAKHLQLTYGVHLCMYGDDQKTTKPSAMSRINAAIESQVGHLLKKGDYVVCVYATSSTSNTMRRTESGTYANIVELMKI